MWREQALYIASIFTLLANRLYGAFVAGYCALTKIYFPCKKSQWIAANLKFY